MAIDANGILLNLALVKTVCPRRWWGRCSGDEKVQLPNPLLAIK